MTKQALAALLLFSAIGCKPESARRADQSAKQLVEKRKSIGMAVYEPQKLVQLADAERDFVSRRQSRVDILSGQHAVIASQPTLISLLAQGFSISEASRANVNAKLQMFQMAL